MRTAPAPGFLDSVLDCCLGVNLQGQVALVTGAGRRIGRAIALRLAAEGARMVVHYRNSRSEAEAVAAEIVRSGGEAVCIQAELTGTAEINRLFQGIEQSFGRLDILVNNAAIFAPTPVGRTHEAQWDAILDTNLKAQFFAAQCAAPLLAQSGRGRIINFASLGGLQAWPKYTAYSVSKAGVIMLTRCLARALAPAVTVNAIAPGTISFPEDAPEIADRAIRGAPLRRTGSAEDITNAVVYLIGAGFVTGQVLVVDGGSSIPS
ncbi:MAG: short-chain dehydrogenase [Acidobacteria bacterium]|nr:MAG: short-chain dehydrogenase [Acidobacteriota bacterium]